MEDEVRRTLADKSISLSEAFGLLSFAALAAQGWDWLVALSDEVEYLWGGKFTAIKAVYFCSRYGMLGLQIADQYMFFGFLRKNLHPLECTRLFIYKTVIAQVAMTLIEIVLLLRVYALYNQNFRARNLLMGVFVISTSLEFSAIGIVIYRLLARPACVPPEGNGIPERLYGTGAGLCQSVVFFTTVHKLLPGRQRRTPLTSLLFKESVFSVILVFILVAIVIIYEITRNIYTRIGNGNKAIIVGSAIYSWYLAYSVNHRFPAHS